MATNFTFGGEQDVIVSRLLDADDRWIPDPAATVRTLSGATTGRTGATIPDIAEMAATTASAGSGAGTAVGSGFFQMENIPLAIWFTGLSAASVALQVLNPITTTWETVIPAADWTNNKAIRFETPLPPWRVGCVTLGGDTLRVNVAFARAVYNRHA